MFLIRYSARAVKGLQCKIISWEHFNYLHTLNDHVHMKSLNIAKKES